MQGSMSVLMMWQASIGVETPKKVDTGIAFIDGDNVDEWLEMVK